MSACRIASVSEAFVVCTTEVAPTRSTDSTRRSMPSGTVGPAALTRMSPTCTGAVPENTTSSPSDDRIASRPAPSRTVTSGATTVSVGAAAVTVMVRLTLVERPAQSVAVTRRVWVPATAGTSRCHRTAPRPWSSAAAPRSTPSASTCTPRTPEPASDALPATVTCGVSACVMSASGDTIVSVGATVSADAATGAEV